MVNYPRAEVDAAWSEYKRGIVGSWDATALAELFTADARYRHNLGVCEGQVAINDFIVATAKDHPSMTRWIEWEIVDGDRISFYLWNNLPDPTGTSRRFAFPNTTVLEYAGDGRFRFQADYSNPASAEAVIREWVEAGGSESMPPDPSLRGIDGWAPEPRTPAFSRKEVAAGFASYRERGALAVATQDWGRWADQFTDDAHYREHQYGYFRSQKEIRDWITQMPFTTMEFPVSWYVIDGNRVSALIPNVLPPPEGADGCYGFDNNTILHYAGDGKFSYEEDIYSMPEVIDVITRWVAAGGVLDMTVDDALQIDAP